jgi:hypothetical protein
MALLRWMHLQKLVPLADLMGQMGPPSPAASARQAGSGAAGRPAVAPPRPPAATRPAPASASGGTTKPAPAPSATTRSETPASTERAAATVAPSGLKDALLGEIRASRGFFYNTVVAQAQRIEVSEERIVFTFLPKHQALRAQFEQQRGWLEAAAERLSGRKIPVVAAQSSSDEPPSAAVEAAPEPSTPKQGGGKGPAPSSGGADPKQEAMASPAVRDLLDVFPAQIRSVEEL